MRETCARVLAAALMTGAIAAVVAMSALFDMSVEAGRPITAPPSSLQRSVRVVALPAPRVHRTSVERRVLAHKITAPARAMVLTRRLVIVRTHRLRPKQRALASTKPKAQPLTPAPTVEPAVLSTAPTVPAPPVSDDQEHEHEHDHGNGHDNGHGHGHGNGHEGHED